MNINNVPQKNVKLPLTDMQKGMLYECLAYPGERYYIEQLTVEILGNPSLEQIRNIWEQLLSCHWMLNACLRWRGLRNPYFTLAENRSELEIKVLHPSESNLMIDLTRNRWRTVIDLEHHGFLAVLICCANRIFLVFDFHHIFLDGWSISLLLKEFIDRLNNRSVQLIKDEAATYQAYCQRYIELKLSSIPMWKQYYSSLPRNEPLRCSSQFTTQMAKCEFQYPQDLMARLLRIAQKRQVTMASCLYYIWARILLEEMSTPYALFGITVSGRTITHYICRLMGMFIHNFTLAVSREWMSWEPFCAIQRIQQDVFTLQDNIPGYYTYIKSDTSHSPVHSLVTIQNYPMVEGQDGELFSLKYVDRQFNNRIPLLWSVRYMEDKIFFDFSYDVSIYNTSDIKTYFRKIDVILRELAEEGS